MKVGELKELIKDLPDEWVIHQFGDIGLIQERDFKLFKATVRRFKSDPSYMVMTDDKQVSDENYLPEEVILLLEPRLKG